MQNCLSLQNLRFSSLLAAEDVSSSAAKSEEKLMFSQARITFTMTTLNTVVPFCRNECWKYMSRLWAYYSLVVLVVLVERLCIGNKGHIQGYSRYTTDSPSSKYKHRRPLTLLHNIRNISGFVWKKKPIVSVTYENERIHCYFCLPISPELGFLVFSGFCFRVDLCNGKLNGFMFHWFPLLAALSSDA